MVQVLREEVTPDVLSKVVDHYGTVSFPYLGQTFILPNGMFLDFQGNRHHSEVEDWLVSQGLSDRVVNKLAGSPTMLRDLNCIRASTSRAYFQIPEIITEEQVNSLLVWLDFAATRLKFIEVNIPTEKGYKKYSLCPEDYPGGEFPSDYIVDKIRRYYFTGELVESVNEGSYLYGRNPVGEAFSISGATQSSSIGQHKSSSIDMIPVEDEDDEPETINNYFK